MGSGSNRRALFAPWVLVFWLVWPLVALAEAPPVTAGVEAGVPEPGPAMVPAQPSPQERLAAILASIKVAEAERAELARRIKSAGVGADVTALEEDLRRVGRRENDLRIAFEELATGGVTVGALDEAAQAKPFDWKAELEDVVRPLLEELKRMTERPRTIERLRSERESLSDRSERADRVIARITNAIEAAEKPEVKDALKGVLKSWQSHSADAQGSLQRAEAQLQRLLAPEDEVGGGFAEALREFFAGRGLNIALALTAFAATYLAFVGIAALYNRFQSRRAAPHRGRFARAGSMLLRLLSLVLSLLAAMMVLSIRGDWLILGLLILFLFGFVLALRNSLPRYVEEMRILLNMGGVREGERVIYNGIPWRIKSLNVFSTLHNPLLRGGTIRVPIKEMAALQSRQFVKEEPWFPTREGDFVMLDGDVFGRVQLQTPDMVQLKVVGSTKTWAVADYLAQNPRNLSIEGFAVPITFGLDYGLQADILTTVLSRLRAHIESRLADQVFQGELKELIVEFNEAASSSLNILIIGVFDGAAAEHYWSIRRFLQRCAVEASNLHGWVIPFNQLTVHVSGTEGAALALPLAQAGPAPDGA
ncbi:MAG: hypothetical protein ACFCUJ_13710 [Thiotrichales bacterium]